MDMVLDPTSRLQTRTSTDEARNLPDGRTAISPVHSRNVAGSYKIAPIKSVPVKSAPSAYRRERLFLNHSRGDGVVPSCQCILVLAPLSGVLCRFG
jgi:hypothetical protein